MKCEYDRDLRHHFDRLAAEYDEETSWRLDPDLLQSFRSFIPDTGTRILDLGCGTGILGSLIEKLDVYGIDLSIQMLQRSRYRNLIVLCGDICRLPLKEGIFDLVLVRQVLQYVSRETLVAEINRVCSESAFVVIHHFTVPDAEALNWWRVVKAHIQPHRRYVFTSKYSDQTFERYGWKMEKEFTQIHKRRFAVNEDIFAPSANFFSIKEFRAWILDTAHSIVPDSRIRFEEGIFEYAQTWTLKRYKNGN